MQVFQYVKLQQDACLQYQFENPRRKLLKLLKRVKGGFRRFY